MVCCSGINLLKFAIYGMLAVHARERAPVDAAGQAAGQGGEACRGSGAV